MYLSVTQVEPHKNHQLLLTFENNEKRMFDVTPYMEKGIFKELKNSEIFQSVKINFDTIEWSNQADFAPEVLYKESIAINQ